MREYIAELNDQLDKLFSGPKSRVKAEYDSRAFGAMIEEQITDNWKDICDNTSSEYISNPGKRTIYDFASRHEGVFYGFDVKTKDLDEKKYSDGGVCSVENLLKFLTNDDTVFVVVEVGHRMFDGDKSLREIKYINIAPFHMLPVNLYRIENLGTGQIRFNDPINQISDEIDWNRSLEIFFDLFVDLAIKHYEKVGEVSLKRIDAMNLFKNNGYKSFSL